MLETNKGIIEYLISKDKAFIELYNHYGLINCELYPDIYSSIVFQIIGQMLSKKAADSIITRFYELCSTKDISPEIVSKLTIEQLKECGLSKNKATYILELSQGLVDKSIDFDNLQFLSDREISSLLTSIKGVGSWTADMIMLFSLGRENIFCYQDVALKNGIIKSHSYKTLSTSRFENLRKKFSPYCSYASLYFYKCNDDPNWKN